MSATRVPQHPARRTRVSAVSAPRASVWLLAATITALAIYALDVLFGVLPSGLSELSDRFAIPVVFFGAAVPCALRAREAREEASAWWLFSLALVLWGTGSLYYGYMLWQGRQIPTPSPADGFWIVFYLPAYAALFKLLRSRAGTAPRNLWLDALVGALGVASAGAAVAIQSILAHTPSTVPALVAILAYPVGDLGLLALVVAAITVIGLGASGVWRVIALAFAVFVVTDSVYLVEVAQGTYVSGGVIDLGWPLAAVLIGLAACWTRDTARPDLSSRSSVLVPALSGGLSLALLLLDNFMPLNGLALVLASATIVVILMRLSQTVRANARLLRASRQEAMTDALTHLGNRRQLRADLATHLADLESDRPLMLTLCDLDGFKAYNDTFGHPAGDQLLQRLGQRLADTVTGHGSAYRMGGDEFCTLWHLDSIDHALDRASEVTTALTEHGEAFTIDCSHGSVLLPTETTDPTDALRLADQRLYLNKGSGRASTGDQISNVLRRALAERDSELGSHLDWVAELLTRTAELLGVGPKDLEAARQTALLHDVGKVAIPDAILNKPAALNEGERQFMRRHTLIGERIISAAPAMAVVAKLVRHTHERHDGQGYPDGLSGEDIPMISRIVSVCDAYDAILAGRPYRAARNHAEALAELRRCSGTQFDPAVVDAFVGAQEALAASSVTGRPNP